MPSKAARRHCRALLRVYYNTHPTNGVWYDWVGEAWWVTDQLGTRVLSERAALIRLGLLSRKKRRATPFTGDEPIIRIIVGKSRAVLPEHAAEDPKESDQP